MIASSTTSSALVSATTVPLPLTISSKNLARGKILEKTVREAVFYFGENPGLKANKKPSGIEGFLFAAAIVKCQLVGFMAMDRRKFGF